METGLDYRGARFYDSDACRFLSLDPLAAEYPEWSDYNYVLGNPIKLVDIDGRAPGDPPGWSKKTTINEDDSKLVELQVNVGIKMNAKNISRREMGSNRLPKYKREFENTYSKTMSDGTIVETTLNWIPGGEKTGFYIEITDDVDVGWLLRVLGETTSGKVDDIGNTEENRIQINPTYTESEGPVDDTQTFLHEIGHTGGLRHDDQAAKQDPKNVMHGCPLCKNISDDQLKTIIKNVPERED